MQATTELEEFINLVATRVSPATISAEFINLVAARRPPLAAPFLIGPKASGSMLAKEFVQRSHRESVPEKVKITTFLVKNLTVIVFTHRLLYSM